MLRKARKHFGPDLVAIMERENDVGPTIACQSQM
jgi:hypothetical protein